MTAPVNNTPTQQGTSSTGGPVNGSPQAPGGPAGATTALNNQRQNTQFATLSPPQMQTLIYAPDVQILIGHNGTQYDVSKDIVRGQVVRKENSASSLFWTCANPDLRYNGLFSRMDRVAVFLTRVSKLQVFSGYLDTIPWMQAYPGTVDFRATCTIKRLLHTWWNPGSAASAVFFNQITPAYSTAGDGQATDSGIGSILRNILEQVGKWPRNTVHIQNFPQEFLTFLNNYFVEHNVAATNAALGQQYSQLLLGDDLSPGPMGAVGYQSSDPLGSSASATNSTILFYIQQIVSATDARGMGPQVNDTANSQQVTQASQTAATATSSVNDYALQAGVNQAGQQLGQYASNWSTQNQNSDAAIYALACAMVECGGGTPALQMLANNSDPPTLTFFHTGLSTNGSSSGLYAQLNNGAWGTASQRMNPYASSGMFLDALNAQTGWRNMDPGQAIWQVQQSLPSNVQKYDAAVKIATELIHAFRKSQSGAGSAIGGLSNLIPGAGALGNVLGGGANAIGSTVGNAVAGGTTSPISGAGGSSGGPNPDSEGAINAAYSMYLTPYLETSEGMDCSHLVQLSFGAIGFKLPRDTGSQRSAIPPIPPSSAQRGDILQTVGGGHTGIYLGNGTWIQTGGPTGTPGRVEAINPATAYWAGRVCSNGGNNPMAPFTPVAVVNGLPVSGGPAGVGIPPGTGTGTGGGSPSSQEPIARNLFSYIFNPVAYDEDLAAFVTGTEKAYIDDVPLIQTIKALAQASMRSFQSSPTGDLIFYYPDPFGMDGKPSILDLYDIELKDLHIDLSDQALTTHVYIDGDYTMVGQADQSVGWLTTSGVATVENEWLYKRLIQAAPGDIDSNMSARQLMQKFGVRPYKDSYQIAANAGLEFLLACTIFMGKWAAQYETDIGLTFMPELFPGMRVNLVGHNLTCYVTAVTHTFDWERGFSTNATVSAATNPNAANSIYSSLPDFLNTVSTDPTGGGNTATTGTFPTSTFQAPLAGGPIDATADTFNSVPDGTPPPGSGFPG